MHHPVLREREGKRESEVQPRNYGDSGTPPPQFNRNTSSCAMSLTKIRESKETTKRRKKVEIPTSQASISTAPSTAARAWRRGGGDLGSGCAGCPESQMQLPRAQALGRGGSGLPADR